MTMIQPSTMNASSSSSGSLGHATHRRSSLADYDDDDEAAVDNNMSLLSLNNAVRSKPSSAPKNDEIESPREEIGQFRAEGSGAFTDPQNGSGGNMTKPQSVWDEIDDVALLETSVSGSSTSEMLEASLNLDYLVGSAGTTNNSSYNNSNNSMGKKKHGMLASPNKKMGGSLRGLTMTPNSKSSFPSALPPRRRTLPPRRRQSSGGKRPTTSPVKTSGGLGSYSDHSKQQGPSAKTADLGFHSDHTTNNNNNVTARNNGSSCSIHLNASDNDLFDSSPLNRWATSEMSDGCLDTTNMSRSRRNDVQSTTQRHWSQSVPVLDFFDENDDHDEEGEDADDDQSNGRKSMSTTSSSSTIGHSNCLAESALDDLPEAESVDIFSSPAPSGRQQNVKMPIPEGFHMSLPCFEVSDFDPFNAVESPTSGSGPLRQGEIRQRVLDAILSKKKAPSTKAAESTATNKHYRKSTSMRVGNPRRQQVLERHLQARQEKRKMPSSRSQSSSSETTSSSDLSHDAPPRKPRRTKPRRSSGDGSDIVLEKARSSSARKFSRQDSSDSIRDRKKKPSSKSSAPKKETSKSRPDEGDSRKEGGADSKKKLDTHLKKQMLKQHLKWQQQKEERIRHLQDSALDSQIEAHGASHGGGKEGRQSSAGDNDEGHFDCVKVLNNHLRQQILEQHLKKRGLNQEVKQGENSNVPRRFNKIKMEGVRKSAS